jgi:hypothetical protein
VSSDHVVRDYRCCTNQVYLPHRCTGQAVSCRTATLSGRSQGECAQQMEYCSIRSVTPACCLAVSALGLKPVVTPQLTKGHIRGRKIASQRKCSPCPLTRQLISQPNGCPLSILQTAFHARNGRPCRVEAHACRIKGLSQPVTEHNTVGNDNYYRNEQEHNQQPAIPILLNYL